jgi:peptidoglycan/LPS O-acetylase OafA/YrhL
MFLQQGSVAEAFIAHGYLAVDFFFVLSGFVIAYRYPFDRIDIGKLRAFLRARLARIYPLHVFMCMLFTLNVAALAFSGRSVPPDRYDPLGLLFNLILVQAWGFFSELTWNVPSWSISAEWFVYIMYAIGIGISFSRLQKSIATVGLITAATTLGLVYFLSEATSLGAAILNLALIRCSLQFIMGACIFRIVRLEAPANELALLSTLSGLALVGLAVTGVGPDYVFAPLGFALIVLSMGSKNALSISVGKLKVLTYLGTISYSTYMIHYFVRDWVKFLLVSSDRPSIWPLVTYVICTLVGSSVLYHCIEEPARKAIRPNSHRPPGSGLHLTASKAGLTEDVEQQPATGPA